MTYKMALAAAVLACGNIAGGHDARAGNYAYTAIFVGASDYSCGVAINDSNTVVGEYFGLGNAPYGGYIYYPGVAGFPITNPGTTGILDPCAYIYGRAAINDKNLAVFTYADDVAHKFGPFTYRLTNKAGVLVGVAKKLPSPTRDTEPTAINSNGVVIGISGITADHHGYMESGGVVTAFDPPGSVNTQPTDITADGTVVGYYTAANSGSGFSTHGFIRSTNNTYTQIDVAGSTDVEIRSINTAGMVAGRYRDGNDHYQGFTTSASGTGTKLYSYPGAVQTEVLRVLPNGLTIGNWTDSSSIMHGFTRSPQGVYNPLAPSAGVTMSVAGVNNNGNFVGNVSVDTFGSVAYIGMCSSAPGTCLN